MTQMTTRLGFDPFSGREGGRVRCEIAGSAGGLRSLIETWDAAGRSTGIRSLTSQRTDCQDLVPALVLVVTLGSRPPAPAPPQRPAVTPVTPVRVTPPTARAAVAEAPFPAPPAPSPAPVAAAPPVASPVVARDAPTMAVARTSQAPTPAPSAPVSLLLGAGALGTAGAVPAPSWGALVTVGARRGRYSLSLQGRYDAPATEAVEGGRIRVWALSLAGVPCRHAGGLAGCAIAGAGIIRGSGEGVPGARSGADLWAVVGVRVAYAVPLGETLSLVGHADLLGAPLQTVMRIGDSAVWTTPVLSGAAGLTVLARY